ncbi:MAG: hypothetical protein WBM24_01140 [Candidatus Sulfotelmatobacter sp.]
MMNTKTNPKRLTVLLLSGLILMGAAMYFTNTYNPFVSDSQVYADKVGSEMQQEAIHHQKVMGCLKDQECYDKMKQIEIDRRAEDASK